jgi:hypothetical protein
MRQGLAGTVLCALACAAGTGEAVAASLTLAVSPASVPAAGGNLAVTVSGHADRDGTVVVYRNRSTTPCARTGEHERLGSGGNPLGVDFYIRQNLSAGENFTDHATVEASPGASYRLCGYLGDFNDQVAPDATADKLVCASNAHVAGGQCVANAASRPSISLTAPARAHGRFSFKVTWTARASEHTVFVYAQPRSIPCYRTGEGERNHGFRGIRTVLERDNVPVGRGSRTVRIKESKGGVTRLCAYLYGFNDVGRRIAFAQRVVG